MTYAQQKAVEHAVDLLVHGYEEEMNLYAAVHDLTLAQKEMLRARCDLGIVCDVHAQKERLLALIGRIETQMDPAKKLVMKRNGHACPSRHRLAAMLDGVATMIEDIRAAERANARLLETAAA